jgi:phosphatidylglycerol---prolipoprotein diacylglyceryl transferase
MIPYIQIPDWTLVSANAFGAGRPSDAIAVRPFGTLVALAVVFGGWLSLRHARRAGLPTAPVVDLLYWVAIGGFLGGHVFDVILYHPHLVLEEPLVLLNIASGQSSFGGFIGAALGASLWQRVRRRPLGPFAEVIASSFPAAWVVGRLGCAVAHDHPGIRSDLWFAVAYPTGGRLDLGLIEAFCVVPLAVAALWLRRRRRAGGYFVALMCLYYAPFRFTLDFLRSKDLAASDARYAGLTPAQWATLLLFGVGLYFSPRVHNSSAPRPDEGRAT